MNQALRDLGRWLVSGPELNSRSVYESVSEPRYEGDYPAYCVMLSFEQQSNGDNVCRGYGPDQESAIARALTAFEKVAK